MGQIHMKFPFKTLICDHCTRSALKPKENAILDHFKTLIFSLFPAIWQVDNSYVPTAPKFDWHAEDRQQAFDEWKGQITQVLRASSIKKDIWFATIIGYLGEGRV